MTSPLKKTMSHNTLLKVLSLVFGYAAWYVIGNSHTSTTWITVPLCFYNIPHQCTLSSPETIRLHLVGKRAELRALDIDQLAIHINAHELRPGKNLVTITEQSLFLPESIKVVHCLPSNPIIEFHVRVDAHE